MPLFITEDDLPAEYCVVSYDQAGDPAARYHAAVRTRSIATIFLAVSLAVITACSDDSNGTIEVEYGTYVRLADPSFESIEACEAAKEEANGALFNCTQILTLNEDGTFFRILTDIAQTGSFTIEESTLVLTQDGVETTTEIPINDDGILGDGWQLDPDARPEEG